MRTGRACSGCPVVVSVYLSTCPNLESRGKRVSVEKWSRSGWPDGMPVGVILTTFIGVGRTIPNVGNSIPGLGSGPCKSGQQAEQSIHALLLTMDVT